MKSKYLLCITNIIMLFVFCQFTLQAQEEEVFPGPGKGPGRERIIEKMEAMRVAYLTNRLDLNTDESTKFWPLYNEYSRKRMELRKDLFELKKDAKAKDLSEKESEKVVENQFITQEQELTLKKNYYEKFKAILPSQKLAKLEPAEMEFNREVIQKLKERRERRMGGGMREKPRR